MGNCQAAEAAAVVIQHPGGKVERLYWPTTAADVMRSNPDHYVALVILRVPTDQLPAPAAGAEGGGAKITRVKLLKPKDTLLLGQVYRLITSQEVTKALRTRKQEKMRRCESTRQPHEQLQGGELVDGAAAVEEQSDEEGKRERERHRSGGGGGGAQPGSGGGRGRHWRPSLQSISESTS